MAVPCFCLLTGGFGLSVGVVLSVMTGQKGLKGLFLFAASVMPQAFFYVPVWCLLILWGIRRGERLRIFALASAFPLSLSRCGFGSVAEPVFSASGRWIKPGKARKNGEK